MKSAIRALQITHTTILESMPEENTRERVYAVMSLREIEAAIALLAKHEEGCTQAEDAIASELIITPFLADTTSLEGPVVQRLYFDEIGNGGEVYDDNEGREIGTIIEPEGLKAKRREAKARERQAEGLAPEIPAAEEKPGPAAILHPLPDERDDRTGPRLAPSLGTTNTSDTADDCAPVPDVPRPDPCGPGLGDQPGSTEP